MWLEGGWIAAVATESIVGYEGTRSHTTTTRTPLEPRPKLTEQAQDLAE